MRPASVCAVLASLWLTGRPRQPDAWWLGCETRWTRDGSGLPRSLGWYAAPAACRCTLVGVFGDNIAPIATACWHTVSVGVGTSASPDRRRRADRIPPGGSAGVAGLIAIQRLGQCRTRGGAMAVAQPARTGLSTQDVDALRGELTAGRRPKVVWLFAVEGVVGGVGG